MNLRQFKKTHLLIVLFLGFSLFFFSSRTSSEESATLPLDTYAQLKEQIKDELRVEIKEDLYADIQILVQEQVQSQWKAYLAEHSQELWEQHAQATQDFNYADKLKVYDGEPLNTAVQRIVHDIFASGEFRNYISDNDLDKVVAGTGIPRKVNIGGGFYKHPSRESFELAKAAAENGQIKNNYELKEDDKNWLMIGGDEEIQSASLERTLVQKGSILLPKGQLQLENGTTWAHFSSANINIQGFLIQDILAIGTFATEEIKRDIFIQTATFKYGIIENLQGEVKVPWRGQYSRTTVSSTSEETKGKFGVGDVELGLSRQIAWEEGWIPDLIAAVNFKTRTGESPYNRSIGLGTGHYAVRTSLIAAKASDPAVIFGSVSYTQNFERSIDLVGDVDPGETIGYSVGMAIALSYQTAINFSFDHTLGEKIKIDSEPLDGSFLNSANVKIGANWAFNERASMDFGVSFGVTEDAPDVSVDVRFPFLF